MNRTTVAAALLVIYAVAGVNSAEAFGRRRPRPAPAPTHAPAPAPYNYSAEEIEGIRLVNEHRMGMGLSEVKINDFISNQCLSHDTYMIGRNTPSHDGFVERQNAITRELGGKKVGEIVAYNYNTPEAVVSAWLRSDGHRVVIEEPDYRRVGYSVRANSSGKKFYTMIFSE